MSDGRSLVKPSLGTSADVPEKLPAEAKPLWKVDMTGRSFAGVVAAGDRVIVMDHEDRVKDIVRCLSAADGKELWKYEYANEVGEDEEVDEWGVDPRATPVIADGKVVVLGAKGQVVCLNLADGKKLWEKDLEVEFKTSRPDWGFCSSPTLAGGNVIVNPGGKVGVAAMSLKDGSTVWGAKSAGNNYASFIVATLGGVTQVVGIDAAYALGLDAKDGKELWKFEIDPGEGYLGPSPLAADGKLLLVDSRDARLHEFDGAKAKDEPAATSEDFYMDNNSPVMAEGMILGTTSDGLMALSPKDLSTLWKDDSNKAFRGFSHIITGKGRALVLGENGTLVLVKLGKDSVSTLGSIKVSKGGYAGPALVGDKLFVRDEKTAYCYELK